MKSLADVGCGAQCSHVDRTKWPPGPWDGEPDRVDFEHAGLPCLIHRGPGGNWCGYVGVPPGHPWHRKTYSGGCTATPPCEKNYCDHTPDSILEVHGGITYSGECAGHLCHVPKPGEPDTVWWFGFDCHHSGDLAPRDNEWRSYARDGMYRDQGYVTGHTKRLADQLAKVTP